MKLEFEELENRMTPSSCCHAHVGCINPFYAAAHPGYIQKFYEYHPGMYDPHTPVAAPPWKCPPVVTHPLPANDCVPFIVKVAKPPLEVKCDKHFCESTVAIVCNHEQQQRNCEKHKECDSHSHQKVCVPHHFDIKNCEVSQKIYCDKINQCQ